MLSKKTFNTLIACLFAGIFAIFITGCSEGGSSNQADTGVVTPSPFATVYNELTAVPGPMAAVRVGELATLDGSLSSTTATEALSYSWSFSYKPVDSIAVLQGATTATPSFIADVRGVYMVQLLVSIEGAVSRRAIALVVATLDPERLTGPFNHIGMSSNCSGCHNGVNRVGNGGFIPPKGPDHLATSNTCQSCHTPQGFAITPFIDHQEVFGNCSECHNGVIAIGKSDFHAPTNAECDDCHNTSHFLELNPDGSFDHTNITRSCSGCHNGGVSIGKTPDTSATPPGTHPVTKSECGYCHTTISFLNAYPDHTSAIVTGTSCDSCHVANGAGSAQGQSTGHPVTTVDCDTCHNISGFKMPGGLFNHSAVNPTVQSCESCHNDSTSINAPAKSSAVPAHPATTADCGLCHNTDSFRPAFVSHEGIVDNCQTCHGNNSPVPPQVTATGKPITTPFYAHMPTSPDNPGTASDQDCGDCHTTGTFTTGTYDHVGAGSCNACHDNVISVGKLLNHIPTTPDTQDCADCHTTTNFADVTFSHVGIVSNCVSCHDGNISTGKASNHLPTSQDCVLCHSTAALFKPAVNFAHSGITDNCESCHNGSTNHAAVGAIGKGSNHIPSQGACVTCHNNTNTGDFASPTRFMTNIHPGLVGGCEGCHTSKFIPGNPNAVKSASHIPTTQDCDVCHVNSSFTPTIFNHSGITGNCESCHNGNFVTAGATAKTQDHPATTADCGSCHAIENNFNDGTFDHTGIVSNCAACHGDTTTSTPVGPKKNPGHVPTTQDCSICHVPGTFANAVFDHTGIVNNCASCHDGAGAVATVKHGGHLPTSEDCSVCHNTTAFAGARFDHQGITNNCETCHDGATARGKTPPPNHVPTNSDCSVCHLTTGFIPGTFDHTGIVDNCRSCHDGAYATGKTDTHIQTNQDCGICHTTSLPLSFTGAVFDHTGITNNCESCHDGVTAIGKDAKTNPAHLATSLDCYLCHTTATFKGGTWVHDSSTAGQCDVCHASGGGATAKPQGHLATNDQCDVCHTTNGWAPTSFSHDPQGGYPGDHRNDPGCNGCHGSPIDNTLPYPHLQYAPPQRSTVYCAACHAGDFERKGDHIGGENGTVEQNKNCGSSGCHRVSDRKWD